MILIDTKDTTQVTLFSLSNDLKEQNKRLNKKIEDTFNHMKQSITNEQVKLPVPQHNNFEQLNRQRDFSRRENFRDKFYTTIIIIVIQITIMADIKISAIKTLVSF